MSTQPVRVMAGIPSQNMSIYHRIRFSVGDPVALVDIPRGNGWPESTLIIRDIEAARAKKNAKVNRVTVPADFTPAGGFSGDRETAMAQALVELLRREGIREVISDRTLALSYADEMRKAGVNIKYDAAMGVTSRRAKDEQELNWLRQCQKDTEAAIEFACRTIAHAKADGQGVLQYGNEPLTSERVRVMIDAMLLKHGYDNPPSIVACGADGGDCHDHGHGVLRVNQPVIVDIFPRSKQTLYWGDSTRTVVNGEPTAELVKMHAAVVAAKKAATEAVKAGVKGDAVHAATIASLKASGYERGLPKPDSPATYTSLQHGTGHGIGLQGHEPPLVDAGTPELVVGDVITIEPGLYSRAFGGVRIEDMVAVTKEGWVNLGTGLQEGLDWR